MKSIIKILLSTTLSIGSFQINAQLVINGSDVFIGESATLYVDGDVVILDNEEERGLILNTGNIELTGNWENNSMGLGVSSSNGSTSFIGSDQMITGTQNSSFGELVKNGLGNLFLNLDTYTELLTLEEGILQLEGNNITVLNGMPDAISSIDGWITNITNSGGVSWAINTVNTFEIPFGREQGELIPVTLDLNTTGSLIMGDTGLVTVNTYATDEANQPRPIGITNLNLDGNSNDDNAASGNRFWTTTSTGYSMNPDVNLSIDYSEDELVGLTISDLMISSWNPDNGTWGEEQGVFDNINGSVNLSNSVDFTSFVIWSPSSITGVQSELIESESLHPNPAINQTIISLTAKSSWSGEIRLMDQLGKELLVVEHDFKVGLNQVNLNLEGLSGLVQVLVSNENGVVSSNSLIINK